MFDPKNRIHWVAAILIAIILILILGVTSAHGQEPRASDITDRKPGACGERPVYMPRDVEPRLVDRAAVREHLVELQEREHPDARGGVILWVCVATNGQVSGILVHTTSGDPILDTIALRVVATARYSPPMLDGRATTVWIAQPDDFVPRQKAVEL